MNHIYLGSTIRRFESAIGTFSTLRTDPVTTIATVGVDVADKYVPIFFHVPTVSDYTGTRIVND